MYSVMKGVSSYVFSSNNYNYLKMFGAITVDLVTTAINIGAPLVIVDSVARMGESDKSRIGKQNIALIAAAASLLVARALPRVRDMFVDSVRANVQKELTKSMVKKTFENELDQQVSARTGEFAQALSKNYSSVDKGIPSFFGAIIPSALEILATSTFLTIKFGSIGVTPIGVLAIYGLVALYGERSAETIRRDCVDESYKGYGAVIEAVGNYQIAHQFENVDYELRRVDNALVKSEDKFRAMHLKDDRNALKLSLINGLAFVGSMALFFIYPPDGDFKAVDFALYAYFMTRINALLDILPSAVSGFNTAIVDGERIVKYLQRESKIVDPKNPRVLDTNRPLEIEFRDVSFSYQSREILKAISFKVDSAHKLAIVGPTGCGKSTIMKLLLRFYTPSSGEILVNGVNISEYSAESLRRHFAVVSQDSAIFNDTIAENIRYGDLAASDEEVYQAAVLAELVGPETRSKLRDSAGLQGGKLSGGEKQRTAIARALLKGGAACILDEPTSALDAKTEHEVQRMLDQITNHATTLLVTHRLSTVVNADNILYMEKGEIVEQGTFSELLAYKEKFFAQLEVQCRELGISIEDIRPDKERNNKGEAILAFWRRRQERAHALHGDIESEDGVRAPLLASNRERSIQ